MTRLPQGWALARLDQVTTPRGEKADPSTLGELPFLGMDHIEANTANLLGSQPVSELKSAVAVFKAGDLLYGRLRPYLNKVHLAGFDGAASAEFIVFPPQPAIEQRYLQCILRSPEYRKIADQRSTGDRPRVKFENVGDYEIPLPPLPEQQRIVRKLDTLSARSRKARAELEVIPALVERYKLNFLRSVFRGEQTASFRDENDLEPVSLLLARTNAPEQGRGGRKATGEIIPGKGGIAVNDPGTELPEGWAWVPLLRVARQETGHTPSRAHPEWWGGDACWVSIPDANKHHGQVIHDTIQKTNEAGLANSSARLLPEGTVVLSRTASVGYVTILGREMATSQDFATWTCSAALEPKYLMYALMSEGDDIRDFGEGSTHTTIYFPEIRAFNIKLAPLEEQREIVRRIEKAFGMMERVAAEADKARKLVDRLDQRIFAKAFAGELVPQNPNDEPASALLERIREAHTNAPKKTRQKRTEVYAMKETPRDRLIADSTSWPENGLPFEDVAKRVLMPHDDLRDALFELLGGTTPVLEQVFDKSEERMRLKRATS